MNLDDPLSMKFLCFTLCIVTYPFLIINRTCTCVCVCQPLNNTLSGFVYWKKSSVMKKSIKCMQT